jgi:threonylcarbamoyladenosine tRNA methylthiotransferase MtaB
MPTFFIEQFGCRATQADGAALEYQLLQRGYSPASRHLADVVVINTCTVTAAADAQARDAIRKITAQNSTARLVVPGCYAQRAPEELAVLPGVAWVVGNSHKPQLPAVIENLCAHASGKDFVSAESLQMSSTSPVVFPARILTGEFERKPLSSAAVFSGKRNHTRPTLKIQDGCNSRCSYCVIPFVRGKSRSLPPATVLEQVSQLVAGGAQEIVLSGINLGTYGQGLTPRVSFEDLLRRILGETPVPRLRVSSIEPMDVTRDLIDFFAANDRMAEHFHMPLQSGCNRILGAMHRWYRTEHYARRVELIRERFPRAAIGADVIAGFPGETAEEHAETLAFIASVPFTYLHVFSYSSRPGTQAAKLSGHLAPAAIRNRARELRALGEKKASAFGREQLGRDLVVLTLRSKNDGNDSSGDERTHADAIRGVGPRKPAGDCTPALSSNYLRVKVRGAWPSNQWLNVRPIGVEDACVLAEATSTRHRDAVPDSSVQ